MAITHFIAATQSETWLIELAESAKGQRRQVMPAAGDNARAAHLVAGWAPDGHSLYILSDRASEFRELMRVDLSTGALVRLSADTPWDLSESHADARKLLIAFTANIDGAGRVSTAARSAAS